VVSTPVSATAEGALGSAGSSCKDNIALARYEGRESSEHRTRARASEQNRRSLYASQYTKRSSRPSAQAGLEAVPAVSHQYAHPALIVFQSTHVRRIMRLTILKNTTTHSLIHSLDVRSLDLVRPFV
jgi:hypothetical protein